MMLSGYFDSAGRALVRLRVRGKGNWMHGTFEIDTGAQPEFVTSLLMAEHLQAETETRHAAVLANGTRVPAHGVVLELDWFDEIKLVQGIGFRSQDSAAFLEPSQRGPGVHGLIGRALLVECRLTIDFGLKTVMIERSKEMPA